VPLEIRPTEGATSAIRRARLVKAHGELRAVTPSLSLHLETLGAYLLMLGMILWVVWSIRQVIATALAGRPFDRSNHRHLRRAGILLIASGVVWPAIEYVLAAATLRHVASVHPPVSPALTVGSDWILAGLMVLVLSAVFSHGADLEDERTLTV
jgi:hypothetical protein